jgi:putative spermidine/putrescine transport system substrate-binding protein
MKRSLFRPLTAAFVCASLTIGLSACGSSSAGSAAPSGDELTGTVSVGTFGGQYKELIQKYVEPEFKKAAPNVKIVYTESTNAEDYIAKTIAEKSSKKGSYDVLLTGSSGTAKLTDAGVLADLDSNDIPNLKNLKADYRNDKYFAAQIYSAITLAYNKNEIKEAPDSWSTLFSDKYKGKIGVMSNMSSYWTFAAVALESKDPLNEKWTDHFDRLKKLKTLDAKFYSTNDALGTALQTGEVWVSLGWRARNALLTTDGGQPIGDVVPKEGTLDGTYGSSIPKNAPNPKAAQAFVNATLSATAQVGFGEAMGYVPTVTNAKLSSAKEKQIGFTADEQKRITHVTSKQLLTKQNEILDAWNEQILNQ